jgi:propionyl-CoA carboxylase beta chain
LATLRHTADTSFGIRHVEKAEDRAARKQHAHGKKTARERLALLLDSGSFIELDGFARHRSSELPSDNRPYGDGVVTGYGTVDGRPVAVFAQDFTVFGGALGEVHGEKICKVLDWAAKVGCPVIGINDGAGGRIQEGVVAQAAYGEIFYRNARMSGVVPQVSLILGPCAGGAAYSPALTDFVVMVERKSHMFVTGPDVLAAATGEQVDIEDLGGARVHNERSGNAHYCATDEGDAIDYVKALLSYLPSNHAARPPVYNAPADGGMAELPELDEIIPDAADQPYDMRAVLELVLDDGALLEVHELFARNVLCGFGRIAGKPVGVVANQPLHLAGCLDIDAADKAARFVRSCDAFNVPILSFVDVPGFLPGIDQEWRGIIRHGAKLLYAYAEATVGKITVVTRKAYGGAYVVMGSKHLRSDFNFAWPTARIAVMGAEGAVNVLHRRELAASPDTEAVRARHVADYEATHNTPYRAAERGYVDAVISPSSTRRRIAECLSLLCDKNEALPAKRHGNMPV